MDAAMFQIPFLMRLVFQVDIVFSTVYYLQAACNIHDLCYITPGSTKKACDDTFVENIILIYCDNVNVFERIACRGRAQLAGAVVSGKNYTICTAYIYITFTFSH